MEKIETKFTPVNPGDFKELTIDCTDSKVMYVTIVAGNELIICNSWPIDFKRVVVTKEAQLRKGEKDNPLKVHKKYLTYDMSLSTETVLAIDNARNNPVRKSCEHENLLKPAVDLKGRPKR